jgi:hypothetical protein
MLEARMYIALPLAQPTQLHRGAFVKDKGSLVTRRFDCVVAHSGVPELQATADYLHSSHVACPHSPRPVTQFVQSAGTAVGSRVVQAPIPTRETATSTADLPYEE